MLVSKTLETRRAKDGYSGQAASADRFGTECVAEVKEMKRNGMKLSRKRGGARRVCGRGDERCGPVEVLLVCPSEQDEGERTSSEAEDAPSKG